MGGFGKCKITLKNQKPQMNLDRILDRVWTEIGQINKIGQALDSRLNVGQALELGQFPIVKLDRHWTDVLILDRYWMNS